MGGRGDLDEHQLAPDGPLGGQALDGVHADQLAQLVADQPGLPLVGNDLNGDAGHGGVVGGAHGQGLDVVALAGEQPGHPGQHARFVVHQHRQGVPRDRSVHNRPSPQSTMKSVMSLPPPTMGRTISSMLMAQSITVAWPLVSAAFSADSKSAALVTRRPVSP